MALVGRLKDELSLFEYRLQIDVLASQITSSFLKLNTTKTKELVLMEEEGLIRHRNQY